MNLSPDEIIFWQQGFFKINATIAYTWGLMLVLVIGSILITRKLSKELQRSRWQNFLEIIVMGINQQIEEVGLKNPKKYIGFLGTLFLFVAIASLFTIVPGYEASDRFAIDHRCTRNLRVYRSTHVWRRRVWDRRIP